MGKRGGGGGGGVSDEVLRGEKRGGARRRRRRHRTGPTALSPVDSRRRPPAYLDALAVGLLDLADALALEGVEGEGGGGA